MEADVLSPLGVIHGLCEFFGLKSIRAQGNDKQSWYDSNPLKDDPQQTE
jgi:hypothetical protein